VRSVCGGGRREREAEREERREHFGTHNSTRYCVR
jgi:hypothetical protein